MRSVFISYKREDEDRVALVVEQLEKQGLEVWWDRNLPVGQNWQTAIEQALDAASVVLVFWSVASVGLNGKFVRDEARRAGDRLLPVLLDPVRPPLGFGEIHSLDLTSWRGNSADPDFRDLLAAIAAQQSGLPPPAPEGPKSRAIKRFIFGGVASTLVASFAAVFFNVPAARDGMCALPIGQPSLQKACCELGLTAKVAVEASFYTTQTTEMSGYVRQSATPFTDQLSAESDALKRAEVDATTLLCAPRAPSQRLASVDVEVKKYDCRDLGSGQTCAADYIAACTFDERPIIQTCR